MKDRGSNPRWRVFIFFIIPQDDTDGRLYQTEELYGGVAQMVEHSLCMRGARGSIPRTSIFFLFYRHHIYETSSLLYKKISKKRQRQGSNLRSQRETA